MTVKKKAVANRKQTAPAVADNAFEEDIGSGFEDADREAYAIPFITILQSGSPQCKKSDGAYMEKAEEGSLYNTVTEELLSEELTIIPVHYKRSFIEWEPKDGGGGFIAEHSALDGVELLKQCERIEGANVLPNGNHLVDTRTHFVMVDGVNGYDGAVISMASTQVKKSRKWMSKMQGLKMERKDGTRFTPPMYSHKYKVHTVPESNDKGSWFGWKIENIGVIEDGNEYNAAKAFREAILSGEAKEQQASTEEF